MTTDTTPRLLALVRSLEAEHGPGGWPAVEMATLSGLADAVERHAARVASLEAELVAARANQKLAAFGAWAAREFRDTLSDVDGGSAQEQMERTGVIVKREVAEPCGEGCVCAGYGAFPHECFVFADDVRAALGATEQKGETK